MAHSVDFLNGFGLALSALARVHGKPDLARDIAETDGLSISDFEFGAKLDDFDMDPLREAWGEPRKTCQNCTNRLDKCCCEVPK